MVARFTLPVVAVQDDVDDLAHVSNIVYLRWVQDAATSHSSAVGWTAEAYRALGAIFVVRRHEIDYLAPTLVDDAIDVVTWVADWRGASSLRRTEIRRRADDVVLARAATTWAFVDLARGRPRRIPADLREAFGEVPVVPDQG